MGKFAIVIHGGAGPAGEREKKFEEGYRQGLAEALEAGYSILEKGGSALDAVQEAVQSMENDSLFNAGRGAAITDDNIAEMCASIMDGKRLKSGAAAIIQKIKNPILLARTIMEKTNQI